MRTLMIPRPVDGEYAPFYHGYVSLVPAGDVVTLLERQLDDTLTPFEHLTPSQSEYRYAPGKWSPKEIIGHVTDAERIFVYRALSFARGEQQALPGFDENAFVANASFATRTMGSLCGELRAVRAATVAFFGGLTSSEAARRGTANGNPFTVRALAYIVAGHERHHANVFRERYVPGLGG